MEICSATWGDKNRILTFQVTITGAEKRKDDVLDKEYLGMGQEVFSFEKKNKEFF